MTDYFRCSEFDNYGSTGEEGVSVMRKKNRFLTVIQQLKHQFFMCL